MKILAVDDQKLNLIFIEKYLRDIDDGLEVFLCQNPTEAIGIAVQHGVDIILLDIIMTPVNGIDLLRGMRAVDGLRNVPILMFSSVSDSETIRKCFELGANDYLTKPINEKEFAARMRGAISGRKAFLQAERSGAAARQQWDWQSYMDQTEQAFQVYDELSRMIEQGADCADLLPLVNRAKRIRMMMKK